ncbi:hypothetical protein HY408_02180 [Candidatus Gottesmanbacteria bacterium]|nr:hypothetical protein [Candidatus Gottesmanbacteria bacterium]
MRKKRFHNTQRGQAILIILLVVVVGLSLGLILAGRVTQDIQTTTTLTDSSKAFHAAEAGIEEALVGGALSGSLGGSTYTVNVSALTEQEFKKMDRIIFPEKAVTLNPGDVFTIMLSPTDAAGNIIWETGNDSSIDWEGGFHNYKLNICYDETPVNGFEPAIFTTFFYRDTSTSPFKIKNSSVGFDLKDTRQVESGFLKESDTSDVCPNYPGLNTPGVSPGRIEVCIGTGTCKTNKVFGPDLEKATIAYGVLRIRALYAPTKIGFYVRDPKDTDSKKNLPPQGQRIESVGKAEGATRKIVLDQPFSDLLPVFDYAIYQYGTTNDLDK